MIHQVGAVLLAAGAASLGLAAVYHMRGRVRDLEQLILALDVMDRELNYRLAPLPEMLTQAADVTKGHPSRFFRLCAMGAEHLNGRTFSAVWHQTLEAGQLRLEQSDMALLEQLGGVLGRYDGESQRQAMEQAAEQLREQHRHAEEQSRRLGKVYGVLGLTAGAFVLILMI